MTRLLRAIPLLLLLASYATAQRLPELAVPENYKLSFALDFHKQNFAGEETIQVRVLHSTSQIVLNALEIDFHEVSIISGGTTQKAKVTLGEAAETATLTVEQPLAPGPATILIRYTSVLNDDLRGFYLGKDQQGRRYAVTQFEATDARRAFPAFDEPAYKATFDVTVVAPKEMLAIANTRIISDTPGPGESKHIVRFATSPKMSCYLLAIAVGEFEYIEGAADGIPIRVFSTPGRKQLSSFALEAAENILLYYDQYFGIKYPYEKLDLIGLPDFSAGAMENTGFITFRESLLLLDEPHASVKSRKYVAGVIAHEMAHQWFGDLVTMQWWDDVWLNEGLASWMSTKPLEVWKPEWNFQLDDVHDTVKALDLDSLANTHPIHQSAETPRQILGLFDEIAYSKAAAVLRMLESYLGPEVFRTGMNQYLKEHAYGNATSEDFWNALARVSNKPVGAIMPAFVNQPGAPMVSLQSHCTGNSTFIALEQQRYLYDRGKPAAESGELWDIPVCVKTKNAGESKSDEKCVLLAKKEDSAVVPGCVPWILANANAGGYYRSSYQSPDVRALAQVVESTLTPAERVMLLADVWAAVRLGREPIGDYLALGEGLRADHSQAVMEQLLADLDFIGRYLVGSNSHAVYRAWMHGLLESSAKELGPLPKPGESDERKSLRAAVLRVFGGLGRDPQILAQARKVTQHALDDPASVDPEMAAVYFDLAAMNGDAALFDEILAKLKDPRTPEEYDLCLKTLADFRNPQLLQKTLAYAISPAVRGQDVTRLVGWVMQNPAGRDLAWDFARKHWADIGGTGGAFEGGEILTAAGTFCDAARGEEVKDFFDSQGYAESRALRQSLERITHCVGLKSRQQNELTSWLEQHEAAKAHAAGGSQ